MSIRLMADVWENGPEAALEANVLAHLANHANDDGQSCYPSIARVARMCRISDRSVQRAIVELEKEGWLTVVRGTGKGNFSQYTLNVAKLQRVTSTPSKGDIDDTKGDIDAAHNRKNHQEPSENPEAPSLLELTPNDPLEKLSKKERISRGVTSLFAVYVKLCDRDPGKYTLTPARMEKGAARFEECLTKVGRGGGKIHVQDWHSAGRMFLLAIEALADSDWHNGRDTKTEGKRYNDWIDNLCKSPEQFEKWLERAN